MAELLRRRKVVRELLKNRGDLLIVGGLGSAAWDITDAGDSPTSFPLWGAMGGAALIGLGIALAQPKKKVLVITGDGDMLMAIGALATISVQKPRNLSIVVLDNEHYAETGMQPTHTGLGVDLAGMAKAAGFAHVMRVNNESDVAELRSEIYDSDGPLFSVVKIDPEKLPIVLPPRDGAYLKNRFRMAVLGANAIYE